MPAAKKVSKKYPVKLACMKCANDAKPAGSGKGHPMTASQRAAMKRASRTENKGPVVLLMKTVKGVKRPCQRTTCAVCGTKKFRFVKMQK